MEAGTLCSARSSSTSIQRSWCSRPASDGIAVDGVRPGGGGGFDSSPVGTARFGSTDRGVQKNRRPASYPETPGTSEARVHTIMIARSIDRPSGSVEARTPVIPSRSGVLETIRMPLSLRSSDRYRTEMPGWKCQLMTTSVSIARRDPSRRSTVSGDSSGFSLPIIDSWIMQRVSADSLPEFDVLAENSRGRGELFRSEGPANTEFPLYTTRPHHWNRPSGD